MQLESCNNPVAMKCVGPYSEAQNGLKYKCICRVLVISRKFHVRTKIQKIWNKKTH